MKIQILGAGCPTCKRMHEMTVQAIKELGLDEQAEYVTGDKGVAKIIELGTMRSPVLAINGEPVMEGFIPDIERIKSLITSRK